MPTLGPTLISHRFGLEEIAQTLRGYEARRGEVVKLVMVNSSPRAEGRRPNPPPTGKAGGAG